MIGNHARISWVGLVQGFRLLPNLAHSGNHLPGLRSCLRISTVLIHMEVSISVSPSFTHTKSKDQAISKVVQSRRVRVSKLTGRRGSYVARSCACEQLTSTASIHQTMEVFPCSKNKKKGDNKWPFTIENHFAVLKVLKVGGTLL